MASSNRHTCAERVAMRTGVVRGVRLWALHALTHYRNARGAAAPFGALLRLPL